MPEATAPVTAPTAAPVAAPPPSPVATPSSRTDERIAKLTARLKEEESGSTSEPAAETATDAPAGAAQADPPASSSSAADSDAAARAQATQERLARIAKVRAREAADRQKRQKQEQQRAGQPDNSGEIEKMRQRLAELEPLNKVFESEDALLSAAEAKGMTADKLAAWLRTRLTDPQAVAQRQVKTEADQLRAEIAQLKKQQEEWQRAQEQSQAEREQQAEAHQRAMAFLNGAQSKQETHPYVARFLARHGAQATVGYANRVVAPLLGEDYTLDELHDHFEQLLEETQLAGGSSRPSEQPGNGASQANRNGAGQPVTTLSNSVAGERSTVEEAVPLHKMPLDKRAEYLKAKYARE